MSVGGRILEIKPHILRDQDDEFYKKNVLRIWVIDSTYSNDETFIYAEPQKILPKIGENIWWQGKKIFFDNDKQHLTKIGYSHPAN